MATSKLLGVLGLVVIASNAHAQVNWTQEVDLAPRGGHRSAYDSASGRTFVFGGGASRSDLWAWDGRSWTFLGLGPEVTHHAMAYDASRRRLVVFGGSTPDATFSDAHWEWDGTRWTQRSLPVKPASRTHVRMVYDTSRRRLVLFGGVGSAGILSDHWEFDGVRWIQIRPSQTPPARADHSMAYDAKRQRVVVCGGWPGGSIKLLRDTWEWSGSVWSKTADGPLLHRGASASYDPLSGRIVLVGRIDQQFSQLSVAWSYDGARWMQLASPGPVHAYAAISGDTRRSRTVLVGTKPGTHEFQTWELNGSAWSLRHSSAKPSSHWAKRPSLVYDASRKTRVLVLAPVGGYQISTWERANSTWVLRAGAGGPSISNGAMAYDSARQRTVLFGGQSVHGNDQHWEYDGRIWAQRFLRVRPRGGYGGAMVEDPARRVLVYYDASGTWEWNGAAWQQKASSNAIPWRPYAAMAWHPLRNRVLLYGGGEGAATNSLSSDLWEWDGRAWTRLAASVPPGARTQHAMVFDPVRKRLVVHGGRDWRNALTDTWEWDGASWLRRNTSNAPSNSTWAAMAYDEAESRVALFGSRQYSTWSYASSASARSFGTACVGTRGRVQYASRSLPWIGQTWTSDITNLRANSVAILEFGASDRFWGAIPLPFDLAVLGMPSCLKYVSLDVTLALPTGNGSLRPQIPIPADARLLGGHVYSQVFAIDVGANALGATTSNALDLRLGGL